MSPRKVAQVSEGVSVWASAPCEHGTITLVVQDDRFPFPLVTARCVDHEVDGLAIELLLCATRGFIEPN